MPIARASLCRKLALVFYAALAFSVASAHRAVAGTPDTLVGAGSTFSAPLYQQWIKVYQREHPSVSIAYDVVGSGEGVSRYIAGTVDFGASDVVLSDSEVAKVSQGAVMVPATAGMVVLAYNVSGAQGKLRLPRDVYPGIFSGAIRRWDDPRIQQANPGLALPHREIAIIARQDSSGTTNVFTAHLAAIDPAWRTHGFGVGKLIEWPVGTTMYGTGNEGVATRIKIIGGSIGYVEYGFAKRLGLPMAVLQNKAGEFVEPSEPAGQLALPDADVSPKIPADLDASVADPSKAAAYPIVTFSWLLLYRQYTDPGKAAAVRDFVAWGLSSGQAFGREFGYLPLPNEVAASGKRALGDVGY
jgi:phosphate transport system substrate-binding protein